MRMLSYRHPVDVPPEVFVGFFFELYFSMLYNIRNFLHFLFMPFLLLAFLGFEDIVEIDVVYSNL